VSPGFASSTRYASRRSTAEKYHADPSRITAICDHQVHASEHRHRIATAASWGTPTTATREPLTTADREVTATGLAYAQQGDPVAALKVFKTYVRLTPTAKDVALISKRIARLSGH
jgi:hypothetical protein